MRIAHLGTFDVENYGDLLFPEILRRCLEARELELVPVSPRGGPAVWADAPASLAFRDFLGEAAGFDGIVVGGGNLIHSQPSPLEAYADGSGLPLFAYADLWLGAAVLAERHGLPLCWNAPGVSQPRDLRLGELGEWALGRVDYKSVRDQASVDYLKSSHEFRVVPDTALELARLWSRDELERAYAEAWHRRGASACERAFVVHLKDRYRQCSVEEAARHVGELAEELEARPILLAIGPCHGDGRLARAVAGALQHEHLLVEAPHGLLEVAALIAGSVAYVGSSLHGMVSACALSVPGLLVASSEVRKFQGFLTQVGLQRWQVGAWAQAREACRALRAEPAETFRDVRARVGARLDEHWRGLAEGLARRPRGARPVPAPPRAEVECSRGLPYEQLLLELQALDLLERMRRNERALTDLRDGKRAAEEGQRRARAEAVAQRERALASARALEVQRRTDLSESARRCRAFEGALLERDHELASWCARAGREWLAELELLQANPAWRMLRSTGGRELALAATELRAALEAVERSRPDWNAASSGAPAVEEASPSAIEHEERQRQKATAARDAQLGRLRQALAGCAARAAACRAPSERLALAVLARGRRLRDWSALLAAPPSDQARG